MAEVEGVVLPDPLSHPLGETQRDALLIDMHGRLARIEGADLDSRVRSLEKKQWSLLGTLSAAIVALLGIHHT